MPNELKVRERDVLKGVTDLLSAKSIPWYRMNSGDRFGNYTSKRTGKTNKWRIRGCAEGTPDILASPCLSLAGCKNVWADIAGSAWIPVYLWIETKASKGFLSAEQAQFQDDHVRRGEFYLVVRDVNELADWLKAYGL